MNQHFIFAGPEWLWAIPALLILGAALWFVSRWVARRRLGRFMASRFLAQNLVAGKQRRLAQFSLTMAVLLLLLFVLARPLSGPRPGTAERSGVDLVIALDISKSMLTEDIQPSRLEAVRKDLREWLKTSAQDRIALVPFAGDGFVMSPLTFDYDSLDFVLREVGPHSITAGGTNIPAAIEAAAALFKSGQDDGNARVILLISDGENLEGDTIEAARKAYAEDRITIIAVGVGTVQGGRVPADDYARYQDLPREKRPPVRYIKDEYGVEVNSRADERALREIAGAAGGRYYSFAAGLDTFRTVQEQSLLSLARKSLAQHIDVADYAEWFRVPLGAAILLLAAGSAVSQFRRRVASPGVGVPVVRPDNFSAGNALSR